MLLLHLASPATTYVAIQRKRMSRKYVSLFDVIFTSTCTFGQMELMTICSHITPAWQGMHGFKVR